MAEQYSAICPSQALAAATAKTLIELTTGSTIDMVLIGFDVGFDGISASAVPVKVELITYTTTGTGTTYTPNRVGQNQGRASITTAKNNMTVEGTGSITVIANWVISPTTSFSYLYPLGREVALPPSKSIGLRVTAPAIVNATANAYFEE